MQVKTHPRFFNRAHQTSRGFQHGALIKMHFDDQETISKISQAMLGKPTSPTTRAKLRMAQSGRQFGPDHRSKMRAAHLGMTHSEESRAKMRRIKQLMAKEQVTCPWCGTIGSCCSPMSRWHFENCLTSWQKKVSDHQNAF